MTLKKGKRYDVSDLVEAQYEPGSRGRVLKNLLSIKSKREMDRVEAREQLRALEELINIYDEHHRFTANDMCKIHKIWLGTIYAWAGQYRQVNITKGNFTFAAAGQVPHLMGELEKGPLHKFTPCRFTLTEEVARAIAIIHTELLLIHPFREGNGRVARLLAILMGLQAGLPSLDFSNIKGIRRQEYFTAVKAGLDQDYKPMEKIFISVIDRTLRNHE
ncbi:MAG: Fic family protein [Deltaproteobacteria bacterium]|nr:MAG: Fic family protein [Deltaproteobacteria bacterium]